MPDATAARRGKIQRLDLRLRDVFLYRLHRHGRVHHQQKRLRADEADGTHEAYGTHEADGADEGRAALVAEGLGVWFGLQSFINMGVNLGLLPTKGLTLPFISYGNNSNFILCCAFGLIARVAWESRPNRQPVVSVSAAPPPVDAPLATEQAHA